MILYYIISLYNILNISKYYSFTPSGRQDSHVVMVLPVRMSTESFSQYSTAMKSFQIEPIGLAPSLANQKHQFDNRPKLQPPEHTGLLITTLLSATTSLGRAKFHLAPTIEHIE